MYDTDYLIERTRRFSQEVDALRFTFDGYVYNPLQYAWKAHEQYLRRFVHRGAPVLLLGMNPGPFGMAQTGIPFGEVNAVRSWMGIEESVEKPALEHPARPVAGFTIKRSEISGQRLWGLMQARYGPADEFFKEHAVMNYCPLVFVDKGKTGKNVVPEKLLKNERELLESLCDAYLKDIIAFIGPQYLVGVGKYAERKLNKAMSGTSVGKENPIVVSILHPSPGSPLANAGWGQKVTAQLQEAGIWK